ncbi:hypothetical protein MNB_SM-6-71 [hydrothermal vent metagenome]|uniref:Uncharacterized protein n=1 Tax=hydrothermal vent metagenome TaxID=652676 RepID=A0A1W1CIM6_9ZZZZ
MRKFFLFFIFFYTLQLSANPKVFARLGDVIYDNAVKIKKLKKIEGFRGYKGVIDNYIKEVNAAKEDGYLIDKSGTEIPKTTYLKKLRELIKKNDNFIRIVEQTYERAKIEENSRLFSQVINTGLINTDEHKKEILDYYFAHAKDMNTTGLIQSYLDEDAKLRAKKEAQRKRYKTKKEREAERIREIRERDRIEKERLEKKLQRELQQKKEQIREYQEEELKKTI